MGFLKPTKVKIIFPLWFSKEYKLLVTFHIDWKIYLIKQKSHEFPRSLTFGYIFLQMFPFKNIHLNILVQPLKRQSHTHTHKGNHSIQTLLDYISNYLIIQYWPSAVKRRDPWHYFQWLYGILLYSFITII